MPHGLNQSHETLVRVAKFSRELFAFSLLSFRNFRWNWNRETRNIYSIYSFLLIAKMRKTFQVVKRYRKLHATFNVYLPSTFFSLSHERALFTAIQVLLITMTNDFCVYQKICTKVENFSSLMIDKESLWIIMFNDEKKKARKKIFLRRCDYFVLWFYDAHNKAN